jgi:hypothetical protein
VLHEALFGETLSIVELSNNNIPRANFVDQLVELTLWIPMLVEFNQTLFRYISNLLWILSCGYGTQVSIDVL